MLAVDLHPLQPLSGANARRWPSGTQNRGQQRRSAHRQQPHQHPPLLLPVCPPSLRCVVVRRLMAVRVPCVCCRPPPWLSFECVDVLRWRPPPPLLSSFDVLLSDLMAPTTGVAEIDGEQSAALALTALQLSGLLLRPSPTSAAVVKLFQSSHAAAVIDAFTATFHSLRIIKPPASRAESKEMSTQHQHAHPQPQLAHSGAVVQHPDR